MALSLKSFTSSFNISISPKQSFKRLVRSTTVVSFGSIIGFCNIEANSKGSTFFLLFFTMAVIKSSKVYGLRRKSFIPISLHSLLSLSVKSALKATIGIEFILELSLPLITLETSNPFRFGIFKSIRIRSILLVAKISSPLSSVISVCTLQPHLVNCSTIKS